MASGKEVQEKKKLFYEFCEFASPSFLNMSETQVSIMPLKLAKSGVDLVLLVSQAKAFRDRYPKGVKIKEDIPIKPVGGHNESVWGYKERIVELLKTYTGIELFADPIISCNFYERVINDVGK